MAGKLLRVIGAAMVCGLVLAGCSLPRGAPMQGELLAGTDAADSPIQVVAVSRADVDRLRGWPAVGGELRHRWPTAGAAVVERRIRAGDRISLAIWDSQPDSLVAAAGQRVVPIQNMAVSGSGSIFVPYAGDVRIAGQTADEARATLQSALAGSVPDAQVQLSVEPGDANTIDIVTGVITPGRIQVSPTGTTILSALAQSGGIAPVLRNPVVRLNRAGHAYAVPARVLFSDPRKDIALIGGDRVLVEEDQRSIVVFGASGEQRTVFFDRERMAVLDALSQAGGLAETRADIEGVMVLREYPRSALRTGGPEREAVVFTFDLSTADGLFAASNFGVMPGDVVLATESPLPLVAQIAGIFRNLRPGSF